MKYLRVSIAALVAACLLPSAVGAKNIVWVTPHAPGSSAAAVTAGFAANSPPDIGYTDFLTAAGHSVTRFLAPAAANNTALSPTDVTTLNAADLIIISRSTNSGVFDNSLEFNSWNTQITKPMIINSGFVTRNTRLGLTQGTTTADITSPTAFKVNAIGHPIFNGITLNGNNETAPILSVQNLPFAPNTPQLGASINNNTIANGGTLLASVPASSAIAPNGPLIAEFNSGVNSATGGGGAFGAKRLLFITGSREVAPASSDTAGILDLSAVGQQIYLNAVNYLTNPILPGDTNGNGVVELVDLDPIKANFHKASQVRFQGDLTGDTIVDFYDFRQWKTAFTGMGASLDGVDLSFASVPEPSSILLFVLGSLAAVCVRRRGR